MASLFVIFWRIWFLITRNSSQQCKLFRLIYMTCDSLAYKCAEFIWYSKSYLKSPYPLQVISQQNKYIPLFICVAKLLVIVFVCYSYCYLSKIWYNISYFLIIEQFFYVTFFITWVIRYFVLRFCSLNFRKYKINVIILSLHTVNNYNYIIIIIYNYFRHKRVCQLLW